MTGGIPDGKLAAISGADAKPCKDDEHRRKDASTSKNGQKRRESARDVVEDPRHHRAVLFLGWSGFHNGGGWAAQQGHKRRIHGLDGRANDYLNLSALLDYAEDTLRCLEPIGVCPTGILECESQPACAMRHTFYVTWTTNEVKNALRKRLFVHLCLRV